MTREEAIDQLLQSSRGRDAARGLLKWLTKDGMGLDGANQQAVLALIEEAWRRPMSTRDLMRDALRKGPRRALDALALDA